MNDFASERTVVILVVASLAVMAAGLAFGVYHWKTRDHWYEQSRKFEKEAEAARDSTEQWKERAQEADSIAEAQKDSTEATRKRAESAIRELQDLERRRRVVVTELESDSVVQAVRKQYPKVDSLITAQSNVIETQEQQLSYKDSIITSQDLYIMRLEAREATQDSVIAQLEDELALAIEQGEEWREDAKPGLLEFSFEELPKDIALFALGRLSGEFF